MCSLPVVAEAGNAAGREAAGVCARASAGTNRLAGVPPLGEKRSGIEPALVVLSREVGDAAGWWLTFE